MNNGNAKIAMLLPNLEGGGAERVMATLAGALASGDFRSRRSFSAPSVRSSSSSPQRSGWSISKRAGRPPACCPW